MNVGREGNPFLFYLIFLCVARVHFALVKKMVGYILRKILLGLKILLYCDLDQPNLPIQTFICNHWKKTDHFYYHWIILVYQTKIMSNIGII